MGIEIKICGLTDVESVDAALAGGADWLGFVFFSPSPRHLSLAKATELGARAAGRAGKVALCVDASDGQIDDIIDALRPDLLQLHGSETPERVAALRARLGRPVMKALGVGDRDDLRRAGDYLGAADRLLFDARPPRDASRPGGNGVAFDWTLLTEIRWPVPLMLSGGLDAGNVGQAIARARPNGVDVSSGVERAPGVKDPELIEAFIAAVRAAPAPQPVLKDMPA